MVAKGALAIQGNHDAAAADDSQTLDATRARRDRLDAASSSTSPHVEFLRALPLDLNEDDRLYVHASASAPQDWIYMLGPREAFQSFRATAQRLTFCGHTHVPALFNESATSLPQHHVPVDEQPMPLLSQRRWIAVLGAVGQPRDHNPAACYGLLDTDCQPPHLSARALRRRRDGAQDPGCRPARRRSPSASSSGQLSTWPKPSSAAGMAIDGFRLEERLHRGGMATIWRVSRDDIDFPIVMKVPFLDYEGDLSLLVGFEVEQMIMAELKGPHVPRWIANGDFAVQPYIVMEYLPGPTLLKRMHGSQADASTRR